MGYRRGSEVIAYSIVAQNVQINTLGDVAYVRMELALLGISNPSTNVELAESRVSKEEWKNSQQVMNDLLQVIY